MRTAKEYLNETISEYNGTVNDMSKFRFNKRESELFENMIRRAQKDAYNQAIDDAAECLYDDELQYRDYHDFSAGVESVENSGKKEILNLKK